MTSAALPNLQSASPFAQLPAEVLTRITRWLPTPDLSAVRLTCKAIERKTFASWSYEFFRKRQFMITTFSLQTLVDIAKHEQLGPMLTHVCISTDRPVEYYTGVDVTSLEMVRARLDQDYLFNTGLWIELLAEAFKSLPNLETIDIRDFSSASRFRDGPDAKWYSYGSTTLFNEAGIRPPLTQNDYNLDRLFVGVVLAAARSGTSAPNLEVITRQLTLINAFHVSAAVKPEVSAYLSKVKKLHLVLRSTEPDPLEAFLHLAHNVTWLRVNYMGNGDPAKFLEWLSTPVNNDTMDAYAKACADADKDKKVMPVMPMDLPLDSLELGSCRISITSLEGITQKLPLRSLSLWRVHLGPESPANADPDAKLWRQFIGGLEGSDIRRLTIGHATESSVPGVWGRKVTFKGGYDTNQLKIPARRYRNEMFRRAAEDTEVAKAPDPVSDSDSDEEDDDSDGNGDGDEDVDEDEDDEENGNDNGADGNGDGAGDGEA